MQSYINRIKEVNPVLNCVVDERFDDALEDARKVDELIRSGSKIVEDIARETPFLGVPFTTKDCIQVKGLFKNFNLFCMLSMLFAEENSGQALCWFNSCYSYIFSYNYFSGICFKHQLIFYISLCLLHLICI